MPPKTTRASVPSQHRQSEAPGTSETLEQGLGHSQSRNQRVRLTEEEKLILIRLCLEHQDEHTNQWGAKGKFWNKIRERFEEKTRKDLKDPQQTVRFMTEQLERDGKKEQKESRMIQADIDVKQGLWLWREHEVKLDRKIKEDKTERESAAEVEANEVASHRGSLLRKRGRKEAFDIEDDQYEEDNAETEDDAEAISKETIQTVVEQSQNLRNTKKRHADLEEELAELKKIRLQMRDSAKEISGAMRYVGDQIAAIGTQFSAAVARRDTGESSHALEKQIQRLEEKTDSYFQTIIRALQPTAVPSNTFAGLSNTFARPLDTRAGQASTSAERVPSSAGNSSVIGHTFTSAESVSSSGDAMTASSPPCKPRGS